MIDDTDLPPTDRLASLVKDAAPTAFAPGFEDRVRARLAAERTQAVPRALEHYFVRIVPLAAAAALMLAAYNWWGERGTGDSLLDAALKLPQVSVASAYSASSLFGVTESETGTP